MELQLFNSLSEQLIHICYLLLGKKEKKDYNYEHCSTAIFFFWFCFFSEKAKKKIKKIKKLLKIIAFQREESLLCTSTEKAFVLKVLKAWKKNV